MNKQINKQENIRLIGATKGINRVIRYNVRRRGAILAGLIEGTRHKFQKELQEGNRKGNKPDAGKTMGMSEKWKGTKMCSG